MDYSCLRTEMASVILHFHLKLSRLCNRSTDIQRVPYLGKQYYFASLIMRGRYVLLVQAQGRAHCPLITDTTLYIN